MISGKLYDSIRLTSLVLLLLWAGEFLCYGTYYFIAVKVAESGNAPQEEVNRMLPVLFGVVGGVSVLCGIGLKWFIFSRRRAQVFLAKAPVIGGEADLTPEEQSLAALAKGTIKPYIISLAMLNSCVIFGLVLAIAQRDSSSFMPFVAGSMAGSVLCFPRLTAFVEEAMFARG